MRDGSGAHAGGKYGLLAKVQETGNKGHMRMEARGRCQPTMKDALSSGAVNATEEKAND